MADEVKLTRGFWKAKETPLTAANLNLMVDAIIDNKEAIEEIEKSAIYTFKNYYCFPNIGQPYVEKQDSEGREIGGPLYLDLSTNKLYKCNGLTYEFVDYAIQETQIISCGGAN